MDPPLTHSKKQNGKQSEKSTKREKRGLEPTDPESYCCCDSTLLKCTHEPTHPPKKRTKEKRKKSKKFKKKTGRRGLELAHLASYCCKQYISIITSVQQYM